jgi:hypothetical protein
MARHAHRKKRAGRLGRVLAAVVACGLAGCATVGSPAGGWTDRARSVTEDARERYAAKRHVPVFREPGASSEIVHRLLLHEKVQAYQVENGFAYVRVDQTGQSGWVLELDLIDEIPARSPARAAAPPQPKAAAQPDPGAGPAPDAAAEVAPAPEAPEQGAGTGTEPEPDPEAESPPAPPEKSVFDPY